VVAIHQDLALPHAAHVQGHYSMLAAKDARERDEGEAPTHEGRLQPNLRPRRCATREVAWRGGGGAMMDEKNLTVAGGKAVHNGLSKPAGSVKIPTKYYSSNAKCCPFDPYEQYPSFGWFSQTGSEQGEREGSKKEVEAGWS
jgi:hypothetical protein